VPLDGWAEHYESATNRPTELESAIAGLKPSSTLARLLFRKFDQCSHLPSLRLSAPKIAPPTGNVPIQGLLRGTDGPSQ